MLCMLIVTLRLIERQDWPSLTSLHNTEDSDAKTKNEEFREFAAQNTLVNHDPRLYTSPRKGIDVRIICKK